MEPTALQILYKIALGFGGLGVGASGLGYFWGKIKGGAKEAKAESTELVSSEQQIKEFYKKQNEDLQVIIAEQTKQINELSREVGEIKGQLNAETAQKKEFLAILQGRDPQTQKFMEFMTQCMKDQTESHTKIVDKLMENGKMILEIHKMTKDEHERDFKVEATVTKQ